MLLLLLFVLAGTVCGTAWNTPLDRNIVISKPHTSVQYSGNGLRLIAYGGEDLTVFDAIKREVIGEPIMGNGQTPNIRHGSINDDGSVVVTMEASSLRIFNLNDEIPFAKIWTEVYSTSSSAFNAVAVSGDGMTVAYCTNTMVKTLTFSSSTWGPGLDVASDVNCTSVSISDDGTLLVVGSSTSDTVDIYRQTGTTWTTEQSGLVGGRAVALSDDGTVLAHTSSAETLYVRTHASGWTQQFLVTPHPNFGYSIDMDQTGNLIVVGSRDSTTGVAQGSFTTYEKSGATWAQKGVRTTSLSPDTYVGTMGTSIAVENTGTTLVTTDDLNPNSTRILFYTFDTLAPTQAPTKSPTWAPTRTSHWTTVKAGVIQKETYGNYGVYSKWSKDGETYVTSGWGGARVGWIDSGEVMRNPSLTYEQSSGVLWNGKPAVDTCASSDIFDINIPDCEYAQAWSDDVKTMVWGLKNWTGLNNGHFWIVDLEIKGAWGSPTYSPGNSNMTVIHTVTGDLGAGSRFATSLDVNSDASLVVVGAYGANKVRVYSWDGTNTTVIQTLVPPDTDIRGFGRHVYITNDGTGLIIYAKQVTPGSSIGNIFMYTNTGGQFVLQKRMQYTVYDAVKWSAHGDHCIAVSNHLQQTANIIRLDGGVWNSFPLVSDSTIYSFGDSITVSGDCTRAYVSDLNYRFIPDGNTNAASVGRAHEFEFQDTTKGYWMVGSPFQMDPSSICRSTAGGTKTGCTINRWVPNYNGTTIMSHYHHGGLNQYTINMWARDETVAATPSAPTVKPTFQPTRSPLVDVTNAPTNAPTTSPITAPPSPIMSPTKSPTVRPTAPTTSGLSESDETAVIVSSVLGAVVFLGGAAFWYSGFRFKWNFGIIKREKGGDYGAGSKVMPVQNEFAF